MNSLIIYYSRGGENYLNGDIISLKEGNTEKLAKLIQKKFKGDMFKVEQKIPYSNDYSICIEQANDDKRNNHKPELISYLSDITQYDTIFIGYPNYWSDIPMALYGQLEKLNFTGKNIYLFCTHEGSGLGSSLSTITKICVGAYIGKSFEVYGHTVNQSLSIVKDKLEKFYKENNLL